MTIRSMVCGLAAAAAMFGLSLTVAASDENRARRSTSAVQSPPEYVDASGYFTSDADVDAWYALVANLRRNFDDICGDTFCEGDYSNIHSLRYRCSVERSTGTIGSCVWVFAASQEEVNPRTGKVIVDAHAWRCRSPIVRGTSIHELLAALGDADPLYAPLPNTNTSIYDGLTTCL